MKTVLLGASKGMGRALARLLAARGDRLFLLGDHVEELAISARDLEIRGAATPVKAAHCDLLQPDTFAPALDQAQQELDGFDTVVVTAGIFATQEQLESDPQLTARLLTADFTNTVLFCEEVRKRLLPKGDITDFWGGKGDRRAFPEQSSEGGAKARLSPFFARFACSAR